MENALFLVFKMLFQENFYAQKYAGVSQRLVNRWFKSRKRIRRLSRGNITRLFSVTSSKLVMKNI